MNVSKSKMECRSISYGDGMKNSAAGSIAMLDQRLVPM